MRAASWSRGTIDGRNVELLTSNSTLEKLTTRAASARWATVSAPAHQASGTDATAAARVRSIATCTPRSGSRWLSTPAGRPMSSQATYDDAVMTLTSKADAPSTVMAVSGSATAVTADPTALTVMADHHVQKRRAAVLGSAVVRVIWTPFLRGTDCSGRRESWGTLVRCAPPTSPTSTAPSRRPRASWATGGACSSSATSPAARPGSRRCSGRSGSAARCSPSGSAAWSTTGCWSACRTRPGRCATTTCSPRRGRACCRCWSPCRTGARGTSRATAP